MYEVLGKYYDELFDGSVYGKWKEFVSGIVGDRHYGADVGCGSGVFTVDLALKGKEVVGIDLSRVMLGLAFERAVAAGVKPSFVCAKAEKFALPRKADFITAINDVVNYMKDPIPFFAAAARNLRDGGLLLFDVSSEHKLKNVLAGRTFSPSTDNTVCVWENSPLVRGKYIDMSLKFFRRRADGTYTLEEETQRQYVHRESDLIAALEELGFKTRVYGDMTARAPKKDALRLHFAAVKRSGNDR